MTQDFAIHTGTVLLAEPFMLDPNFRRSVILLCDHDEMEGSIGFVLNRPLNMQVNDLVSGFPEFPSEIHFGGPVATDTIHFLHTKGNMLNQSREVSPGVYWGGDFEQLKTLVETNLIKTDDIRFYVGYSGWGGGQLMDEMHNGSWVSAQMNRNYAFKGRADKMWKQAMTDVGAHFSVIAQIPEFISLN